MKMNNIFTTIGSIYINSIFFDIFILDKIIKKILASNILRAEMVKYRLIFRAVFVYFVP